MRNLTQSELLSLNQLLTMEVYGLAVARAVGKTVSDENCKTGTRRDGYQRSQNTHHTAVFERESNCAGGTNNGRYIKQLFSQPPIAPLIRLLPTVPCHPQLGRRSLSGRHAASQHSRITGYFGRLYPAEDS